MSPKSKKSLAKKNAAKKSSSKKSQKPIIHCQDAMMAWLHDLHEGVVLIQEEQVIFMNQKASDLLHVDMRQVEGSSLLAVLRDHRLEQVYREGSSCRLETRGRILEARAVSNGLLLRDISNEERSKENARELLAVLSHEFRTPVTTLRSAIEALKYDLKPEQQAHFLERAEAEGARLTRLLDDLTVDVKPPKLRRLSLQEHVARAITILQEVFSRHQVSATIHFVEEEDLTVWADSDKLLQVLINLLENAAVHGPDEAEIMVHIHNDEHFAYVAVRDQGAPLDDAVMQELFEAHSRGNSKVKGTGLGLYIVRSIANRWGGEAWGKTYTDTKDEVTPWKNEFGFSAPLR